MRWITVFAVAMWVLGGACTAPAAPVREEAVALAAPAHTVPRSIDHEHADHEGHDHAEPVLAEPAPTDPAQPTTALTRISDHSGVCMLSNRYLGERADVPIEVEGKTYRGCCANCAARLGSHPETRVANDPVTGEPVDKGAAVLARDANNRVYYFENEQSFATFAARH
jgi:YHS domain-containing protein